MAANRVEVWTFDPAASLATWNISLSGKNFQADDIFLIFLGVITTGDRPATYAGYKRLHPPLFNDVFIEQDVIWKRAVGNETQLSITFAQATDGIAQIQIWRGAADPVGHGMAWNSNIANQNPRRYLGRTETENVWIAGTIRRSTVGVDAFPAGYTGTFESINNDGSFGGRAISTAYKIASIGMENPPSFTHAAVRSSHWTICIPPSTPIIGPYRVCMRDWLIPKSGSFSALSNDNVLLEGMDIIANDMIIVFLSAIYDGAQAEPTLAGYTRIANGHSGGVNYCAIYYKKAAGTETQLSFTWAGVPWQSNVHVEIWRNVGDVITATRTASGGSSANANPPSHAFVGTCVTFAIAFTHAYNIYATAGPAGYSDLYVTQTEVDAFYGNVSYYGVINITYKYPSISPEDPDAFTHNATFWNGVTASLTGASTGGGAGESESDLTDITSILDI